MSSNQPEHDATEGASHQAGAFDIRTFIGALIGIYGLVLVLAGLFGTSDAELDKSGGININLYAGLAMIVAAVAFVMWARWRPIVVPDKPGPEDEHSGADGAH